MRLLHSYLLAPAYLSATLLLAAFAVQANDAKLNPQLDQLDAIPLHAVAAAAIAKAEAESPQIKGRPLQIAVSVPLALTLADGVWDEPESGLSRWRSRVFSAGALSLSFEFSHFALPPGAALWIYDPQGQLIQGPYTQANHTPEGKLWTALVQADTAVLELRLATEQREAVQLELMAVAHGTHNFAKAGITGNSAGSCNIDVACNQGAPWRNEIRSVAAYTVTVGNSVALCTGELVNNARRDSTPYFLTANHCNSANNPSSVIVYWNYQNSRCGSGSSSFSQTQSGAVFKASDSTSDFTLLQLNQAPLSSFNVYFAGWDVSGTAPNSGVAIHHPEGDVKKISLYNTPAVKVQTQCIDNGNGGCAFNVNAWAVNWAAGTTEAGSSGNGLWSQNHQIIGVLSGGDASCSNPSGTDYFGRLDQAWQANPSSASGQLKAWLDPDNSGATSLCGQNQGSPCNLANGTGGGPAPGTGTTTALPPSRNSGGAFGLLALLMLGGAPFLRRGR